MAATASLSTSSGLPGHDVPAGLAAGPEGKRTKRIRVPPKISIGDLYAGHDMPIQPIYTADAVLEQYTEQHWNSSQAQVCLLVEALAGHAHVHSLTCASVHRQCCPFSC